MIENEKKLSFIDFKIKKVEFNIVNVISNIFKDIQTTCEKLSKSCEISKKFLEDNIHILSESGWTIQFDFTQSEIIDVILINDKNKIDDYFLEYYTKDKNENFNVLVQSLLESKYLDQWKELLEECIEAFNRGDYKITIPSLLIMLEGVLSTKLTKDDNPIAMKSLCKKQYENENSYTKIAWFSNLQFIELLYEKSDFNKNPPEFLNRHWILHGRIQTNWNKIDSIRLFHVIESVRNCLEY